VRLHGENAGLRATLAALAFGAFVLVSLGGCSAGRRPDGAPHGESARGGATGREMDRLAGELAAIDGAATERVGGEIKVTWENEALFDFDSAMLTLESRPIIQRMADALIRYPRTEIVIAAHTDSDGPDDFNRKLSERRALSLLEDLVELGVAPSRLRAEGHGELYPVAPDDTEEGRRANRRVEITVRAREN
jgi:outer membrane protein OmpA-like peptidoglycan-associated protein